MKYVICPPCGTVFEGETEKDVLHASQVHAREKHGYVAPDEEILNAVTSVPPVAEDDDSA